jgi:hypothetical protein
MNRVFHNVAGELTPFVSLPELRERVERVIAEHKRTNISPRKRDRELYKGVDELLREADRRG